MSMSQAGAVALQSKGRSIVFRDIGKRFGAFDALRAVSLEIVPGEFCTMLGPSGSGKTTLLKLVAGFEDPTSGTIEIGGRPMNGVPVAKRNIGMVFQNYALFPHMSVFDNVAFPLVMRSRPTAEIMQRVASILAIVDLAGLGERFPRQLSGGQQQRVALARALVFEPDLLLMDEPLGALDKNLRQSIQHELRRLHRALSVTIIYVTHDQEEALFLSDRIVVMNAGRVAQVGTPASIYNRPRTDFVARFLGDCNLFEATVKTVSADSIGLDIDGAGAMSVPHDRSTDLDVAAGQRVLLGVRPERVAIAVPDRTTGSGDFTATVVDTIFSGADVTIVLSRLDRRLLARMDGKGALPAIGSRVALVFSPRDAFLVKASA